MLKRLSFFLTVLITVAGLQAAAFANGKVSGKIVDAETGDPMIGANVFFQNTMMGAASDLDGNYLIQNVPPGQYDLVISMIGYAKKVVTGVEVSTDEVAKIDVSLEPEILESDEVVVSATLIKNTESALLKDRQKAVAVSDAISAEAISQSGSGDAAAAMKKVTGASVVGGKYVYIRGLGERYSATTLNGAELPSADPDKKSFQLDLFPAGLLENIITLKTFTPDKPGTFSGGLVDVTTKAFPEQFFLQVSTSTSYNSQTTWNDNYAQANAGGTDWLGYDNGTRELPAQLKSRDHNLPRVQDVQTREDALMINSVMNQFTPVMSPVSATAPPSQSFSIATGNRKTFGEQTLGYMASLSWGQNYSFFDDGRIGRWFTGGDIGGLDQLNANKDLIDQKGSREANWGGIFRGAWKNPTIGSIEATYMHTQSAESSGRFIEGFWRDLPANNQYRQSFLQTRVLSWVERSLDSFQLNGKHHLNSLLNSNLDWSVSYAQNNQDEPDQRYFSNSRTIISRPGQDTRESYGIEPSLLPPPIRYYRNLDERNFSLNTNLTFPFKQWSGLNSKFKTGFSYTDVDREYIQRRFDYQLGTSFSGYISENGLDINGYLQASGIIDSSAADPSDWVFGHTINESSTLRGIFTGEQQTVAGYAMVDMPVVRKLRFIGGVRLEDTQIKGFSADTTLPRGDLSNFDWLPSVNLVYQFNDNTNFRAAYTHTIARPTFREIAPYRNFEFASDFLVEGNPNLQRTLIRNYDVRFEWFMNPGEIVAVSGFFKDFENPIEIFQDPSVPNGLQSIQNVSSARITGVEFEVRKGLGQLFNPLSGFSVGSNLSFVKSETDIPEAELFTIRQGDQTNSTKDAKEGIRDFQGQSPYLFNLDLSYSNLDWMFNAGLFYNTFGDRLSIVTLGAIPDVYERKYDNLDFKLSKKFQSGFKFSFSVKNILNPEVLFSQRLNGEDFVYASYKRGVSYSVSLGYDL